jgi:hypothetical protein
MVDDACVCYAEEMTSASVTITILTSVYLRQESSCMPIGLQAAVYRYGLCVLARTTPSHLTMYQDHTSQQPNRFAISHNTKKSNS